MASDRHRDWANLLGEILTLVAKRLDTLNYLKFSAVCRSWASIASPANGMPPPLPLHRPHPFLLLPDEDKERSESCVLLDVFNKNFRHNIGLFPEIRGKRFIGSQFGWLAVVGSFSAPSLFNPFTRAQIDLPSITAVTFKDPKCIRKVVLSSDPGNGPFTAVAITFANSLLIVRPGEAAWSIVYPGYVADVTCRQGKFFAVTSFGHVYDFNLSGPLVHGRLFANDYGSPHHRRFADAYGSRCLFQPLYLINSADGLLLVWRGSRQREDGSMRVTCEIKVWMLEPETREWFLLSSLGDRALFIATSCSMCLPARGKCGMKENCIYIMDNDRSIWLRRSAEEGTARDIGVFDLSDGSFETWYPPNPKLVWPPPIWITSPLM